VNGSRALCGLALVAALVACDSSRPVAVTPPVESPVEPSPVEHTVLADFHSKRTPALAPGEFELITLSTLPDTVTGGDVLAAVRGDLPTGLRVTLNGVDVTQVFVPVLDVGLCQGPSPLPADCLTINSSEWRGLVTGLKAGENTLIARGDGGRQAVLIVRNHPITGPVISGPHQTPFYCRTQDVGLGEPLDANCSAATQYQWFYRSSESQGFEALSDPYAPYPDDVMMTETTDGRAVPFVVRVESATLNRGIARISVLDDPAARGPDAPFAATQWNRHVYYVYGESCGVGYQQGTNDPSFVLGALALQEVSGDRLLINLVGIADRLGKGDLIVHNTLSAFGVHCNPLVSIETAMITKEHISEQYGLVEQMIGTNGSGAALQQYNALNNAPGLLTAAMPTATFADIASTAMTVTDCGLLQNYYANSDLDWDDRKKAAVNGHNLLSGNQLNAICQSWTDAFFNRVIPDQGCPGQIPQELRYHPETNRGGVRCTIQDANVNLFGRDPVTGFARRPLDNVGVQYGLDAFNAGTISYEEFVDLNRNIGGLDIDGRFVPQRHVMDSEVASILYRLGGIIGRGALAETPVLDHAPYLDLIPVANIHEAIRPFNVRARLRQHSGQDTTMGLWRGVVTQADGYPVMEQWVTALERPPYGGDHVAAVAAAKPAAAGDRCVFGTIGGRLELPDAILLPLGLAQFPLLPGAGAPDVDIPLRVDVPETFDQPASLGPCGLLLPVTSTPRMVAGMPITDDVVKCQLKPVSAADYADALTETQLNELREIFPAGVCDYTLPAAEDVARSLLWVSVGSDTLLPQPVELKWRAGRSN
jgi:hypothetical protein